MRVNRKYKIQNKLKDKRGFFGLLGMLLTLAVILYLFYLAIKIYLGTAVVKKGEEKSEYEVGGVTVLNQKSILDNTKGKIQDIEKQQADYVKELEGLR